MNIRFQRSIRKQPSVFWEPMKWDEVSFLESQPFEGHTVTQQDQIPLPGHLMADDLDGDLNGELLKRDCVQLSPNPNQQGQH